MYCGSGGLEQVRDKVVNIYRVDQFSQTGGVEQVRDEAGK